MYQITGKDMGLFTMLCDKLKAKADRLKMMESMSGVYKHLHKEQTFGHMRKNLRPHTAEGLLKKIYD